MMKRSPGARHYWCSCRLFDPLVGLPPFLRGQLGQAPCEFGATGGGCRPGGSRKRSYCAAPPFAGARGAGEGRHRRAAGQVARGAGTAASPPSPASALTSGPRTLAMSRETCAQGRGACSALAGRWDMTSVATSA